MESKRTSLKLPFVGNVSCGFPNPAADYLDLAIDLNVQLVTNEDHTFFARVKGQHLMLDAGLSEGDVVVVDQSRKLKHNNLVLALLNGEFVVRRYMVRAGGHWLVKQEPQHDPVRLDVEENEFQFPHANLQRC